MEVTVSFRLWAMAWQLAHRGTRSVPGSISPSFLERLDVVDLDVAVRVVLAVGLVEVEDAYRAGGPVCRYRSLAVFQASLVGRVQTYPLAPFAVGYRPFVYDPVGDVVNLQGLLGGLLAPARPRLQITRQPLALVLERLFDVLLDTTVVFLNLLEPRIRDPGEASVGAVEVTLVERKSVA